MPDVVVLDARDKFGVVFRREIDSDVFRALTPTAKMAYIVLTLYATKDSRESFPKQATIAQIVGVTRPAVNKAIGELVEAKLVSRKTVATGSGRTTMTVYTLLALEP